jgi:hypothetical protein
MIFRPNIGEKEPKFDSTLHQGGNQMEHRMIQKENDTTTAEQDCGGRRIIRPKNISK